MFLEKRCPICNRQSWRVCSPCWNSLPVAGKMVVDGVNWSQALFAYDSQTRSLVLAAKNGGRRDLLKLAGAQMAALVSDHSPTATYDAVAWVPASPGQKRQRGFDQGKVLATVIGRQLRVRPRTLLRRSGVAQTGKDRAERLIGPQVRSLGPFKGAVLLVDDVCTTGGSLERAAEVLSNAGANLVDAVVLASTPPQGEHQRIYTQQLREDPLWR